jgi:hypothetical protein
MLSFGRMQPGSCPTERSRLPKCQSRVLVCPCARVPFHLPLRSLRVSSISRWKPYPTPGLDALGNREPRFSWQLRRILLRGKTRKWKLDNGLATDDSSPLPLGMDYDQNTPNSRRILVYSGYNATTSLLTVIRSKVLFELRPKNN